MKVIIYVVMLGLDHNMEYMVFRCGSRLVPNFERWRHRQVGAIVVTTS